MRFMAGNSWKRRRRPSIPPIVAVCALVVAGGNCAARRPPAASPVAEVGLEYLGAVVYAPGTLAVPGESLGVGSLSGLAFDRASGRWVAAMDEVTRPRLVWLDINVAGGGPTVVPRRFTFLRPIAGGAPPETIDVLDMESLVALPGGDFATTNEGHVDRRGVARQPVVLRIARDGGVVAAVRPRPHFTIDPADRSRGVRHNLGLESLTRTPDGRLISGMEQPLAQDGPTSSASRGGRVRLLEFVPDGATWRPGREWPYDLDPTPAVAGYGPPCGDGENGLSELFALDDRRLIALERACLNGAEGAPAFNPVRLHLVDLTSAEDVSRHASLAGVAVRPAAKRLLLDLTTLSARVPVALRTWSNFEGLAAGPPAPDGAPTLLLVSDDNFRATQTLAVVWLKLRR
ncbi:MAG: esterase-like activity of phytase family protein [Vicinamibacterales bacterium]